MKHFACRSEFKKLVLDLKGVLENSIFEFEEPFVIGRVPVPKMRLEKVKVRGIMALDGLKLQELILRDVLVTSDLFLHNLQVERVVLERVRILGTLKLERLEIGHLIINNVYVLEDFAHSHLVIAESKIVSPITVMGDYALDDHVRELKESVVFNGTNVFRIV